MQAAPVGAEDQRRDDQGDQQLVLMRHALGANVLPHLAKLPQRDLKALRQGIEVMRRLMAADRAKR